MSALAAELTLIDLSDRRPHVACPEERLRAHPRVLCIQDTTELDYTKKKGIANVGPLNYEGRWGMYLHPTLVLTPERVPLGLLDAYSWAREPGSLGQEKDPNRPLEEKESVRWVDGFARVNELAECCFQQYFVTNF